jgi:uncharacterized membrane protein HdeD (DUF308 family)
LGCEFNWTKLISFRTGFAALEERRETMSDKSITSKILGVVAVILGIIVAVGPHYIFPVCQYYGMLVQTAAGTSIPMKCYWTAMAEVGLGALIVVAGIVLIVSKQNETKRALGFILAALGVVVALVPTYLIGVCGMAEHPCRMATQPALILLGVITIIIGIVAMVTARHAS